jgi:pseudaminic acid synthase
MITINGHEIANHKRPFIVAEISANHNNSLDNTIELISRLAAIGVDAVKIQTYSPNEITFNTDSKHFVIDDPSSPWHGRLLYDLYSEGALPYEWHPIIFQKAAALGLTLFSTPFSPASVDFLEKLGSPAYKVASFEITYVQLLSKIINTGKPIVLSSGACTYNEIKATIQYVNEFDSSKLAVLACTSAYPSEPSDAHLERLVLINREFGCVTGLSDHTLSNMTSIVATGLGAAIIEKHVTLNKSEGGIDASFSLDIEDFSNLVREVHLAYDIIGHGKVWSPKPNSRRLMRSIYYSRDLPSGHTLEEKDVLILRPAAELLPADLGTILTKQLVTSVLAGQPVRTSDIL